MARQTALQVAPCTDRCIAAIVDDCLSSILFFICYGFWKDGIRDGQSFGKGMFNLRVINYQTGQPASIGDSIVRNCGEGILGGCTCGITSLLTIFWILFTEEKRRMGDRLAGTIVIRD